MSEGQQIEMLKARHAELETALNTEANKPQPDQMTVADIKKRKLRIKDEIARIEHGHA